jgi:hypothetical protein
MPFSLPHELFPRFTEHDQFVLQVPVQRTQQAELFCMAPDRFAQHDISRNFAHRMLPGFGFSPISVGFGSLAMISPLANPMQGNSFFSSKSACACWNFARSLANVTGHWKSDLWEDLLSQLDQSVHEPRMRQSRFETREQQERSR